MSDELTIENAITQAPNRRVAEAIRNAAARSQHQTDANPGKLNLGEQASLQTLKRQMAEAALDQQRIQKQGGPRAIEAKERAQALFSGNIHRSGK